MKEFKHRIGGPAGITVRGWLYLFPWSIWLALGFAPNRAGDFPLTWLVIGILAHLNTGLALLIGKRLFLPTVFNKPRFFTTLGIYAFAGVVRGLSTGYLSLEFNSAPTADYLLRIGICLIVVPLWLGLVAVIVSAGNEHKNRVQELLTQKQTLMRSISSYNQQIAQYRSQVIELVRNAVNAALAPLQYSKDASKELMDSCEQVIRPLSHDLAITELEIKSEPELTSNLTVQTAAPSQILSHMRTDAAFPVGFLPYLFMLTAAPSFLAVAGLVSTATTFLIIAVFVIGGFPIANKLTSEIRERSLLFGWVVVVISWLLVSLGIGVGVHLILHDVPKLAAAGYSSFVIVFVGTVLSSILKATFLERERIEQEISTALLSRKLEADRARALLNAEQESLAAAVHSGVQGTLVAAALKLKDQPYSEAGIAEFIAKIDATCKQIVTSDHRNIDLRESLTAITAVWEGVAEIELNIAEDIYQLTEQSPVLANSILILIRESLSNSVRHGRASQIWITATHNGELIEFIIIDNGQLKVSKDETGFGSKTYAKLTTYWSLTRTADNLTKLELHIPVATVLPRGYDQPISLSV